MGNYKYKIWKPGCVKCYCTAVYTKNININYNNRQQQQQHA